MHGLFFCRKPTDGGFGVLCENGWSNHPQKVALSAGKQNWVAKGVRAALASLAMSRATGNHQARTAVSPRNRTKTYT